MKVGSVVRALELLDLLLNIVSSIQTMDSITLLKVLIMFMVVYYRPSK